MLGLKEAFSRQGKQLTDTEHALKSEGVNPSSTKEAIDELRKKRPHFFKIIADRLRQKQNNIQEIRRSTEVIEQPAVEMISPHEALLKLVNRHDQRFIEGMRKSETSYPSSLASVLEGGPGLMLSGIEYGKDNIPQFQSWDVTAGRLLNLSLHPGENIESTVETQTVLSSSAAILRHRVTPDDYPKIDYEFGGGALSSKECIDLIGSSFEQDASLALANPDEQEIGTIIKEILPGIFLHVEVVDESHQYLTIPVYAEQIKEERKSKYKVIGSFASIPLVGDVPLTGRRLLEHGITEYKKDFHQRYDGILTGESPTKLFWDEYEDPTENTIVEDMVSRAVGVHKKTNDDEIPSPGIYRTIISSDYLAPELRLFLLARMKYDFLKAGKDLSYLDLEHTSMDEQLANIAFLYKSMKDEEIIQMQQARLDLLRKINNREPVTMTGEEKDRAIASNVNLLEAVLVKETPYWDLHDEYMQLAERGITKGNRWENEKTGTLETQITITYETATGKIVYVPSTRRDFLPGDYSRLRLTYRNRGKQKDDRYELIDPGINTIELTQGGEEMTKSEMDRAFGATEEEAPNEENRRVLPTRLLPKEDRIWGGLKEERVQWRHSKYNEPVYGDEILLRALQIFNQRFGPEQ